MISMRYKEIRCETKQQNLKEGRELCPELRQLVPHNAENHLNLRLNYRKKSCVGQSDEKTRALELKVNSEW